MTAAWHRVRLELVERRLRRREGRSLSHHEQHPLVHGREQFVGLQPRRVLRVARAARRRVLDGARRIASRHDHGRGEGVRLQQVLALRSAGRTTYWRSLRGHSLDRRVAQLERQRQLLTGEIAARQRASRRWSWRSTGTRRRISSSLNSGARRRNRSYVQSERRCSAGRTAPSPRAGRAAQHARNSPRPRPS